MTRTCRNGLAVAPPPWSDPVGMVGRQLIAAPGRELLQDGRKERPGGVVSRSMLVMLRSTDVTRAFSNVFPAVARRIEATCEENQQDKDPEES